jgi:hypothetical protein
MLTLSLNSFEFIVAYFIIYLNLPIVAEFLQRSFVTSLDFVQICRISRQSLRNNTGTKMRTLSM